MRNNRTHCLRRESLLSTADLVFPWCIRTRSALRENCDFLCCVPLTYIKVRAERMLIHSWRLDGDVPRVLCGHGIQEMSAAVHTLTPYLFTKSWGWAYILFHLIQHDCVHIEKVLLRCCHAYLFTSVQENLLGGWGHGKSLLPVRMKRWI